MNNQKSSFNYCYVFGNFYFSYKIYFNQYLMLLLRAAEPQVLVRAAVKEIYLNGELGV